MAKRKMTKVDEFDVKILSLLKQNSRLTLTEISRELGVSKTAVKKRIQKLVKEGVIKRFTIEYTIENEVRVITLVKVLPGYSVPDVAEKIFRLQMAENIYEVTGDYDIIVVAKLPDINMVNFLIDKIRGVQGVATTNTHIALKSW